MSMKCWDKRLKMMWAAADLLVLGAVKWHKTM